LALIIDRAAVPKRLQLRELTVNLAIHILIV
jgi:hypothetical protein